MRTCTKCGVKKDLECFAKTNRTKDGRVSRCKQCTKEYNRKNKDRHNELSLARYHKLQEPKRKQKELDRKQRLESKVKVCGKCKVEKAKTDFGKAKDRADGLKPFCKDCHNAANRASRERNPESSAESSRKWAHNNPEKARERAIRWQAENRDRVNELAREWRRNNPERVKLNYQKRMSRPDVRIHHAISSRMNNLIRNKGGRRTIDILGHSLDDLMTHLERQFVDGMSWENYGEWHIDHIIPVSHFKPNNINDLETIRAAWCLTNLQPLWASDNIRKRDKMLYLI